MIIFSITVGYALITASLNINGIGSVAKTTWDVHLENLHIESGSVTAVTPASISSDKQDVNFSVKLTQPGDYYKFNVDIVNAGTIDAMIGSFSKLPVLNETQLQYMDYTVAYLNGNEPKQYDKISKGQKLKLCITIKFKDNVTAESLPSSASQEIQYSFSLNYVVADKNAKEVVINNLIEKSENYVFNNTNYTKNQVEEIYTLNVNEVPEGAIDSWDVSERQNGNVTAYLLDNDNDNLYELYLAQDGGVVANSNSAELFSSYSEVTKIDVSNLNTMLTSSMQHMFYNCSKLNEIIGINDLDVSNVINMSRMFGVGYGLNSSLKILNLSDWDTSSVKDMSFMFYYCSSLTTIGNVSNWDTLSVTDMSYMFDSCKVLENFDLSRWNTSSVTNMTSMFATCHALTDLDLSRWDTSGVTSMYRMFYYCKALSTIGDVSNWNTSSVTDMSYMFSNCTSLRRPNTSKWDMSKVTNKINMFYGVPAA